MNHAARVLRIHLGSLALEEDGAVLIRAEHVMGKRSLAALAACPQTTELDLRLRSANELLKVEIRFFGFAIRAHGRVLVFQRCSTAQTLHRLDSKLHESTHIGCGDLQHASMFPAH